MAYLQNKLSSYYDHHPYIITDVKGSMITASRPGLSITQNTSFYKKITPATTGKKEKEEDSDNNNIDNDMTVMPHQQVQTQLQNRQQQPERRYPQRLRCLPNRLSDFVLN